MTEPLVRAGPDVLDPVRYAAFAKAHQATSRMLAAATADTAGEFDSAIPPLSATSDSTSVGEVRKMTDELAARITAADKVTASARANVATLTANVKAEAQAVYSLASGASAFAASVLAAHPEVRSRLADSALVCSKAEYSFRQEPSIGGSMPRPGMRKRSGESTSERGSTLRQAAFYSASSQVTTTHLA